MSRSKPAKRVKTNVAAKKDARQPKAAKQAETQQTPAKSTKQETVIELLSQPKGATVAAIMKATGWQQHSVYGFLSGVVRKQFGFALESEKTDGGRSYHIVGAKHLRTKTKIENRTDRAA